MSCFGYLFSNVKENMYKLLNKVKKSYNNEGIKTRTHDNIYVVLCFLFVTEEYLWLKVNRDHLSASHVDA